MKRRIFAQLGIALCLALLVSPSLGGTIVPTLSFVESGTTATKSASIPAGTATFSLDLVADTGGLPVSGLQYYFVTSPANTLRFSTTPVVALFTPFTTSDLFAVPASGALVNRAGATTVWFKASAGDYAPFSGNAIGKYTFNTSLLPPGAYIITPVGEELSNTNTTASVFGSPGSFSLTIVPEPGASALLILGGISLLARRKPRRGVSFSRRGKRDAKIWLLSESF